MNVKTVFSIVCSIARIAFGIQWIMQGWFKITAHFNIIGLFPSIASNTDSPHWYKSFIEVAAAPYPQLFNVLIPWGELLVGIGLVLGLLTLPALLAGFFMDINYVLSDMIYIYPTQLVIGMLLLLFRKEALYFSLDRALKHLRLRKSAGSKSAAY
ncbi:DoxX family membrane protein [Paenibacillus humicola]|uniref:DoxX family membrane protein n=1 Tax=Paenibacillus humicola TaxID=3110540 RepID=UPI00237A3D06|nr:DoxX family membrane protein [Paenibacillus humicola]